MPGRGSGRGREPLALVKGPGQLAAETFISLTL